MESEVQYVRSVTNGQAFRSEGPNAWITIASPKPKGDSIARWIAGMGFRSREAAGRIKNTGSMTASEPLPVATLPCQ